ncbi:hypothetical protein M2277_005128 [Paenibacillus sp. LBL]|uniref:hypothetical protein n=1 Tax=Paenibacillus sp. LBL TaxID=2940563 RepID=UPI002475B6A6|nr:hypothetical protein [Paenibacillus sp. LBL]MDH6674436.1 hypothetical protein [Paenibacillus sp. LBL]
MPTFKNMKELEKYLQRKLESSMQDVGKMGEATVKQHVDKDVYGVATPEEYERTGDLKKSVVYELDHIRGGFQVDIYNDSDLIRSAKPNQHYSVVESENGSYPLDYSEFVAETVHNGTSGLIFGTGYWTSPRPFMSNAANEIRSKKLHLYKLQEGLKKNGINSRL